MRHIFEVNGASVIFMTQSREIMAGHQRFVSLLALATRFLEHLFRQHP